MARGKVKSPLLSTPDAFLIPYLGIRNFVVGIIVKVASDEATMRKEKSYANKLNLALVQVVHALPSLLNCPYISKDFETRMAT